MKQVLSLCISTNLIHWSPYHLQIFVFLSVLMPWLSFILCSCCCCKNCKYLHQCRYNIAQFQCNVVVNLPGCLLVCPKPRKWGADLMLTASQWWISQLSMTTNRNSTSHCQVWIFVIIFSPHEPWFCRLSFSYRNLKQTCFSCWHVQGALLGTTL